MSDKSSTLTLLPSGKGGCAPEWNPWKPPKSGKVKIVNKSGSAQKLTNVTKGLLTPSPHDTVLVPLEGWTGTVGIKKGSYQYDDGMESKGERDGTDLKGVRDGTIDPSGHNDDMPVTNGVRSGTIDP